MAENDSGMLTERTSFGGKDGDGAQLMWWLHGWRRSSGITTTTTHARGLTVHTTRRSYGAQQNGSGVPRLCVTAVIPSPFVSIILRGTT